MSIHEEKDGRVRMPPASPELQSDLSRQWMTWAVQFQDDSSLDRERVEELVTSMNAQPEWRDSAVLHITVLQEKDGDYTDLYDSFFRILLKIEEAIAPVKEIQDEPRERWNNQVIFHNKFARR